MPALVSSGHVLEFGGVVTSIRMYTGPIWETEKPLAPHCLRRWRMTFQRHQMKIVYVAAVPRGKFDSMVLSSYKIVSLVIISARYATAGRRRC